MHDIEFRGGHRLGGRTRREECEQGLELAGIDGAGGQPPRANRRSNIAWEFVLLDCSLGKALQRADPGADDSFVASGREDVQNRPAVSRPFSGPDGSRSLETGGAGGDGGAGNVFRNRLKGELAEINISCLYEGGNFPGEAMQLIEAALAFAITMLVLSLVVSSFVELVHRIFSMREDGLKHMLGQLFDQVLAKYVVKAELGQIARLEAHAGAKECGASGHR